MRWMNSPGGPGLMNLTLLIFTKLQLGYGAYEINWESMIEFERW